MEKIHQIIVRKKTLKGKSRTLKGKKRTLKGKHGLLSYLFFVDGEARYFLKS